MDALADEAWVQRGISDRGAGAAAAVYGDDFDGGAASANGAELANGDTDGAAVGRGAAGESGGDVFVCAVRGSGADFFTGSTANVDCGEPGWPWRGILGCRDAGDFRGVADCVDGVAATGGGVGAREHHYHSYLLDWARGLQPCDCGVDEDSFSWWRRERRVGDFIWGGF